MKSEKLKPNPATNVQHRTFDERGSKYENRVTLYIIRLCCFVFLAICLFTFPAGAKDKNENQLSEEGTKKGNVKLNLSTSATSTMPATDNPLIHQLQQARISVYQAEKDSKSQSELKQMVEQIRSILCNLRKQPTKAITVTEPAPAIEPNKASSETKTHEEPKEAPTQPEPKSLIRPGCQYEPVSEHTLQMLESLTQKPGQLKNPFELAEVLFLSGHAKKARMFYQEALNRKDPNDLDSAQERAWILFQIGNCLRNDEPQSAKNTYRQLIAEYPDHLWSDIAKIQEKLLDWYLNDKPDMLIKECEQLAEGM